MKTLFVGCLLVAVVLAGQPYIWPAPQTSSYGSSTLLLSPTFVFYTKSTSTILSRAIARYQDLIFCHEPWEASYSVARDTIPLPQLTISLNTDVENLQLYMDEAYSLTVPNNGNVAVLKANTVWGALRGLETFSQLISYDFANHVYLLKLAPWYITDAPQFPHRGILIDTSRHFQPVSVLKQVIDSLAWAKFNVMHWHVVDSQSFPFESYTEPNLWDGSWSIYERYTQQDIRNIVQYGRDNGIRVMIEFDLPGHAGSWCAGYPEICPRPDCLEPLDPSTEDTFTLLTDLFTEITGGVQGAGLFPEDLFHLGGDEVDYTCWETTDHIVEWMNAQGYDTEDTYMYFVSRSHDIVESLGRSPVNWQEVFNHFGNALDNNTIIHVWLDHAKLAEVVAAGYRGILSNNDVWYLDHLSTTWQQFYLNDLYEGISDPAQQKLVIGGEVCMWGETVDASDIFNTIWPRAAAAAERLWSPTSVTDTTDALGRLQWFRCFMNSRGIAAAPVSNSVARSAPSGPSGCYTS
ncbi:beta-hexosaminidase subunit beta [Pelomyxa schiedti]|nr:beta-hexosaminidase subunit beta [Pelomyxa schiedti]